MTPAMPMTRSPRHPAGLALRVAGLAFALALAGCAKDADATFDLSAARLGKPVRAPQGQVSVSEPLATAPADTDRIVVRPTPDTLATIKGAQWAERLPRLVQTRLLQSFENAGLLRVVARPDARIVAPFSLNTEIRRFDLDLSRGEAVVEISARLVEEGPGHIAAAKIFSARAPAASAEGATAAAALDIALGEVMGQIVVWTAGRI